MKDHSKKFREIQERAYKEAEEKRENNRIEEQKNKIEKEKERDKEQEKEQRKGKNRETASSLDQNKMATPTPQDFYNLQEQFMQMQALVSQLHNSNQSLTQNT
jgi:hypothetical protein